MTKADKRNAYLYCKFRDEQYALYDEYAKKPVTHITWAEDTAMSMFTPEEQKQLIDLSRSFTKNLTKLVNQETED